MTKDEALAHYGTQRKLAAALGVSQASVSTWKRIPAIHQVRLEILTRKKLKADSFVWKPKGWESAEVMP